jgi:hypothetical protein
MVGAIMGVIAEPIMAPLRALKHATHISGHAHVSTSILYNTY